MRWCYKTVHFGLKKEGFLGSSFLDEAEVELSLNEYGQSGWELVSIVETQDGLIAIFKQPLGSATKEKEDEFARGILPVNPPEEKREEPVNEKAAKEQGGEADEGKTSANDSDMYSIRIE